MSIEKRLIIVDQNDRSDYKFSMRELDQQRSRGRRRTIHEPARLSMKALAQRGLISDTYISNLKAGCSRPSRKMVFRIAVECDADTDEFGVLAGYLPPAINEILAYHPVTSVQVLRETFATYKPSPVKSSGE
jgi:hypothetical protein